MGVWGSGLTQSDEYCEVYDSFMEKYDAGESVDAITNAILDGYLSEFDENDGILHDVYFALAKCQWMCGALSDALINTVRDIIQSGQNLVFLKELDADDRFLRDRKNIWINFYFPWKHPEKPQESVRPLPRKGLYPLPISAMFFLIKGKTACVSW